jgi:hypothetical protein
LYFSANIVHIKEEVHTDYYSADVLDGAMVTLAMYTFNFFHPGWLLRPTEQADIE